MYLSFKLVHVRFYTKSTSFLGTALRDAHKVRQGKLLTFLELFILDYAGWNLHAESEYVIIILPIQIIYLTLIK